MEEIKSKAHDDELNKAADEIHKTPRKTDTSAKT